MKIENDISQVNNISFNPGTVVKELDGNSKSLFEEFYNSALAVINETNQAQLQADQLQRDFATGKTDNVLSVTMAQEKASSTLNFTIQVTNKVIEAYREIMRIQI